MDELYVRIFARLESDLFSVPLDSLVTLFTLRFCRDSAVRLVLVVQPDEQPALTVNLTNLAYELRECHEIGEMSRSCQLPLVLLSDGVTCVAGLCAVLRQMVKLASPSYHSLLGFRLGCLMACAEVSLWTRFCEIDIIQTVNQLLLEDLPENDVVAVPRNMMRFEVHMDQPLRVHNIRKMQQELEKSRINNEEILEHAFSEGPSMTLSDVMIFPCFYILLKTIGNGNLKDLIPLTMSWFSRVMEHEGICEAVSVIGDVERQVVQSSEYDVPTVPRQSLYKSDPKRYKPASRVFTRQEDIDTSLDLVSHIDMLSSWSDKPFGWDVELDWSIIPHEAHPEGGNLPPARLDRKREQLENLARAVIKIANPGDVIVDFCSGSGHLGLILAVLLPKCRVILLENKFESLDRARARGFKLSLSNVIYLQSNLDYFTGDFTIGVALHACGVATDLVLERCTNQNASFVCCPCCYGGVQPTHAVTYPRSQLVRNSALSLRDYLVLGHAADQTHGVAHFKTAQGNKCMSFIDGDRCQAARERGYQVTLGKLDPPSCTPKNNLLVGIPNDQTFSSETTLC